MVGRKGKRKSESHKQKISRALKGKARSLRKGAKKMASNAVTKTAGAAGYALGRFGDEIDSAADKAGNLLKRAEKTKTGQKASNKIESVKDSKRVKSATKKTNSAINKGLDKLERGTRVKSVGSATKGYAKGKIDAEKKKRKGKG